MKNKRENIFKTLEEVKSLKAQFTKMKNEVEKDPEEFLKKMRYDLTYLKSLAPEEIKKKFEGLESIANDLSKAAKGIEESILNVENPDSKAIENYYKKIKSQGGENTQADLEKILGFFTKYTKSETEKIGQSCFHYAIQDCAPTIIDAHSLQKKGPLKNISSTKGEVLFINKNELENTQIIKLVKTAKASTFKGFCHKHDGMFQQTIESELFNNTKEHCFLHSYRSFAYSHHMIKQNQDYVVSLMSNLRSSLSTSFSPLTKLFTTLGGNSSLPVSFLENLQLNDEQKKILSITRYESYKQVLNNNLKNELYDNLEYLVYTKNHTLPIACSSWIKSHLNFGNGLLIESNGEIYHGYPIMVTVIPESSGKSHVILARFKSDSYSEILFKQLKDLKKENSSQFELTLSSMILRFIENIYLSPDWWNKLDTFLKKAFFNEINLCNNDFMKIEPSQKVVNLFDEIYKL